MKKILLSFAFLAVGVLQAQDHWDTLITNGVGPNQTRFNLVKVFKNKIYVAGSDSLGLTVNAYSSSTGNYGTFTNETGLASVLQGGNEGALTSATNDNNFMFYGSGVQYNGVNNFLPQVYKFDGTTYNSFGTIPHDVTGANRMIPGNKPFVAALALYSPTGSNDSIYAFVNPDSAYLGCTVWKSPVSSPNWVNVTKFNSASGVTKVNDAIVWHKRLYIAVSGRDSGGVKLSYILSTANGISWDTVAKTSSLFGSVSVAGFIYSGCNFNQLEIHNDTLFSAFTNGHDGHPIWYTTDSLSVSPTWHDLLDVGGGNCWEEISDMQSAFGKLWIGVNVSPCRTSGWSPRRLSPLNQTADYGFDANGSTYVYCYRAGQFFSSSGGSNISASYSQWHDKFAFFNNALYTAGSMFYPQTFAKYGNLWRVVPPTASFTDSSAAGANFCASTMGYLNSTSANAVNAMWTINGTIYSHSLDTTWYTNTPGTYTVTLTAYNGNPNSTNFKDSTTSTITVYGLPIIDTVKIAISTICQGQIDTSHAYVHGVSPFIYGWTQSLNIIGLNDSIVTFPLYTVSTPSPSPIGFFAMDANGCQANYPYTLYITVNAADSLSGIINDTLLNPVSAGKVYLFRLNPLNPNPGDTAAVFNLSPGGYYDFPGLYYGSYIAKAVADTSNTLYKTAVGTYYSNKTYPFQWDSAIVIQHHGCTNSNNTGNNIKILQMPTPIGGTGTISGEITEGPGFNTRLSGGGLSPLGAPLKGVDVKLGKNPGGSPAARTTTDTVTGHFTFTNVPNGSYKIYVDIPNYGMDSVRSVVISGATNSVHNDYYVDSNMVRVVPTGFANTALCSGDSILLGGIFETTAGLYYDTLQNQGHDSLVIVNLSITPLPTLTVTTSNDTICNGSSAILSATGNSTSYLWSANAGSVTTATVSVSPAINTTYTITGTANGCPVKQTINIVVKSCIGIQNVIMTGSAVYPNPANDKLFIEVAKNGSVKFVNIIGQTMFEQAISIGKNEINISHLPQGAYELLINTSGQITAQKLMISK